MMYACALGVAATLADEIGRVALASEYRTRKSEMIEIINKCFYDTDKQFYVDTYGESTYSEHTAVWAVLSDCVRGEEARALLDRSFAMDVARASFSFNYYTFRAIEKVGYYEKYRARLFDGWYKMLDMGCTTWCENPDSPRSECHAWSSAPVYEYSAMTLGVKPVANGFAEVEISPILTDADKIIGAVPSPNGVINVSWEKNGDKYSFCASVPNGIKAYAILNGKRYEIDGELKVTV
jgi:hypothetical protein